MHELAIAQRMIDTAVALLPPDARHITTIKIQLGALAGVSEDELRFGFEAMSPYTPCQGAKLEINLVPAIAHCPLCGIDFTVADSAGLFCPTCDTPAVNVVQGKELLITSLEASDEAMYG